MKTPHRVPLPRAMALAAAATAVAVTAAACGGSSGGGGGASAPGVTKTEILIGTTQPVTGIAAFGYSEIAPASNAYFQYVNAHGGINGRKIVYKVLDDKYDPTLTAPATRQLVLQNNVFAMFNALGTPTHLAVVNFLNAQKVPDVFVATGCNCWGQGYPQTFGWQLDYIREGKILGQYVKEHFAGKKIGYFFQDDEFGQDGVKGLDYEIPSSMVVSRQSYPPTNINVSAQVTALKAAGAQVVVSFSVPAFTAFLKLNMLKLNYDPQLVVSDVGSDPQTIGALMTNFGKQAGATVPGLALTTGIITDGYLPTLGDTSNSWITLFKTIHDQYIPKLPFDGNVLFGESVAYEFVQALLRAGKNPTRSSLVAGIEKGMPQGAGVSPYAYSSSSHLGATGAYMAVIKNAVLDPLGPVQTTDTSPTGAVTTFSGTQPQAPSSGIPSP